MAQKGAFICGSPATQFEMYFAQRFATGFFGGEGFILQKLRAETAPGLVILSIYLSFLSLACCRDCHSAVLQYSLIPGRCF